MSKKTKEQQIRKRKLKTRLRETLHIKQEGKCYWCRRAVFIPNNIKMRGKQKRMKGTLDHLIPKSKGGPLSLYNIVLACPFCNGGRADNMIHPRTQQPFEATQVLHSLWGEDGPPDLSDAPGGSPFRESGEDAQGGSAPGSVEVVRPLHICKQDGMVGLPTDGR